MDKPYVAIFCIVNHGFTDLVMESAKSAGARGGTVLTARGSGNREAEEFFGVVVTPEKEIVMILVPEEIRDKVMSAVNAGAGMNTKGMGIASHTAYMLGLPLVVIRREARYSEGSTVSINYFSGTDEHIQKMSIAKRAVKPGSKAIIIDDFMRGGGSLKGIQDILGEFDVETVGIGVALESRLPEKKKVSNYTSVLIIDEIDEENKVISIRANEGLAETE